MKVNSYNEGQHKSVIICEDLFTEEQLSELEKRCQSYDEYVPTDQCNKHLVQTKSYDESQIYDILRDNQFIPEGFEYVGHCYRIIQNIGGQIYPHVDHTQHFTVSIYLNSVEEGGELEFYLLDQAHTVTPKRNLFVMMTSNVLHWTRPVVKGQRRSIQLFTHTMSKID